MNRHDKSIHPYQYNSDLACNISLNHPLFHIHHFVVP
ncbi:MAG: hypothetical protein JXR39_12690 [Marinilabiliaceae bacterium]|nr:hypothetical protein [Marinilabiliaceae bacterium]